MKTKKASKNKQKSRIIFFAIALIYNLLLGFYLKDFLVLSPILLTFYLLSTLPVMFFVLKIRSTPMRAVVLIVLFFVMAMSIISSLSCRRLLPMLTFVVTAIEMMYFGIVDNSSGKDKLLTKICENLCFGTNSVYCSASILLIQFRLQTGDSVSFQRQRYPVGHTNRRTC